MSPSQKKHFREPDGQLEEQAGPRVIFEAGRGPRGRNSDDAERQGRSDPPCANWREEAHGALIVLKAESRRGQGESGVSSLYSMSRRLLGMRSRRRTHRQPEGAGARSRRWRADETFILMPFRPDHAAMRYGRWVILFAVLVMAVYDRTVWVCQPVLSHRQVSIAEVTLVAVIGEWPWVGAGGRPSLPRGWLPGCRLAFHPPGFLPTIAAPRGMCWLSLSSLGIAVLTNSQF